MLNLEQRPFSEDDPTRDLCLTVEEVKAMMEDAKKQDGLE
jgi:hypothetical protein